MCACLSNFEGRGGRAGADLRGVLGMDLPQKPPDFLIFLDIVGSFPKACVNAGGNRGGGGVLWKGVCVGVRAGGAGRVDWGQSL